jgi:L-fuculokinase
LTPEELAQDSLCYLSYQGKPVKAARIFAGNEHEIEVKRISKYFNVKEDFYKNVEFDATIISDFNFQISTSDNTDSTTIDAEFKPVLKVSNFANRSLSDFENETIAYHQLMLDLVQLQAVSTRLIIQNTPVSRLFIDGGFSKNPLYMNLLAESFPDLEVFAASVAQATAVGAALAIHRFWNRKPLRKDLIELKYYAAT